MNILKRSLFFITMYESIFILFKNYLDSGEDYDYVYGGGRSKFSMELYYLFSRNPLSIGIDGL